MSHLFNAVTLIAISVFLIFEAWKRFNNPQPIKSLLMLSVAVIGLLANLVSVWLLKAHKKGKIDDEYIAAWELRTKAAMSVSRIRAFWTKTKSGYRQFLPRARLRHR